MAKKVLIIEDHPATAEMIANILRMDEIGSVIASNGFSGIEKASAEKPDLILLDVMMPGMNGFEVCEKLKAGEETSRIPVVIVSIRASADSVRNGKKLGAIEYITKPFEPARLREVVKKYLEEDKT